MVKIHHHHPLAHIKLQATYLHANTGRDMGQHRNAFAVHNITENRRKMLEIQMVLTQEVRALTAHLATGQTDQEYGRFINY